MLYKKYAIIIMDKRDLYISLNESEPIRLVLPFQQNY